MLPPADDSRAPGQGRLQRRLAVLAALMAAVVAVVLAVGLGELVMDQARADLRSRLTSVASLAAALVDPELHARVQGPADEAGPACQALRSALGRVRDRIPDAGGVYTMRRGPDGSVLFVVDTEPDPSRLSHPGDRYDTPSPALLMCLDEGRPTSEDEPSSDEWGVWLSAFAPLRRADGSLEGLVGVDLAAADLAVREGRLRRRMVLILVLALLLAAGLGALLARSIVAPLHELRDAASAVARGDLGRRVAVTRNDDLGLLAQAFNTMAAGLGDLAARLRAAVAHVRTAADGVVAAASEQSDVLGGQARTATDVASAVERLSAASGTIARHATSVLECAAAELESAHCGRQAMDSVVGSMEAIQERSRETDADIGLLSRRSVEISRVMEFITTVANRTRLIAFNAALEASSAGEAGARFEVVADEIRSLADSVVLSAREIGDSLEDIRCIVGRLVAGADEGSAAIEAELALIRKTSVLLEAIYDGARMTSAAAHQIATSTDEQRPATESIAQAMGSLRDGADRATAAVTAHRERAQALRSLAGELEAVAGSFTEAPADGGTAFTGPDEA